MNKKLFIVATPIGNMKEISELTISTLNNCNVFFCEDTRNTKKLFNLLNLSLENKKFYCLNGNNEKQFIETFEFVDQTYCLLSDAGYPILSDPGYLMINYFIKMNWLIQVINGPSALMHALISSGFKTSNFLFYGFLSNNSNIKINELQQLNKEHKTIIIFEAVHRIKDTLKLIKSIFQKDKRICVGRELTKVNETIYRWTIDSINLCEIVEKGEFVIVIDNNETKCHELKNNKIDDNYFQYMGELKQLIKKGEKEKIACKIIAYKYNLKANYLYNFWQEQKNCF